jgi:hypothetical protein
MDMVLLEAVAAHLLVAVIVEEQEGDQPLDPAARSGASQQRH